LLTIGAAGPQWRVLLNMTVIPGLPLIQSVDLPDQIMPRIK
jgi:hypothetical protein